MRYRTKKRAKDERQYNAIVKHERDVVGHQCEFPGCRHRATEVHHKAGRDGIWLLIQKFWMWCCRDHHRWITDHPNESYAKGYSIRRTTRHLLLEND